MGQMREFVWALPTVLEEVTFSLFEGSVDAMTLFFTRFVALTRPGESAVSLEAFFDELAQD